MRKYLLILLLLGFIFNGLSGQALQHKPKQLFLSPEISMGSSFILNQNNYGYTELANSLTFGGQFGAIIGYDYYLKHSYKTGIIVSMWGQHYDELIEHRQLTKDVNIYYVQIPATYKYVFGRKRGYDHEVFSPYVFGTVRVGYPFTASVNFYRADNLGTLVEEDLVTFVTEGGINKNTEQILALGNPSKDRHLFSWLDINLEAGAGYQLFVTRLISIFAEAHFVSSILDINAGEWRFRDENDKYRPSYNMYGGIKVGANFYLYKNKR